MNRLTAAILLGLSGALLACGSASVQQAGDAPSRQAGGDTAPRWNILFVFGDDWGRFAGQHASVDGRPGPNDLLQTPHMDRLAAEGVLRAVDAGVDCIEHGYVMNKAAVDALVAGGVFLTPTLTVTHNEKYFDRFGMSAAKRERFRQVRDRHAESFRLACDAGVQIACGSDTSPVGFCTLSEIELMVQLGMTESDAILAATHTSARTSGISDQRGTIEVGKKADFVVLDGNPLKDIGHIWSAKLVVKSGRLVETGRRASQTEFWDILLDYRHTNAGEQALNRA